MTTIPAGTQIAAAYRLRTLELDVHRENSVLFPRALALEAER